MAKILLMEDDEPLAEVLSEFLYSRNHEVSHCISATSARALIEKDVFDILITDLLVYQDKKPVPDGGISLITWLRGAHSSEREEWMREMPIIAMSGAIHKKGLSDILQTSESLGADMTLTKPTSPQDLLRAIESLCAR